MKPSEIDYVVAAILMGAELDASGNMSTLSVEGYRDLIEQIHHTGEWPRQALPLSRSHPHPLMPNP